MPTTSTAPAPARAPAPASLRLAPPQPLDGPHLALVPRDRLVRVLVAAEVPLALVVAPAGYGKTVLLEAWARADARAFAWVRPGRHDPAALLVAAIAQVDGLRASGEPFVLVVDDADALPGRVLEALAAAMPRHATLALAARAQPALRVSRLRAGRQLVELGQRELAMTRREAVALLAGTGAALPPAAADVVLDRAEGWPAALHLAALSAVEQRAPGEEEPFSGADRIVADYLRDEVLSPVAPATVELLTRASILETLSGPLCDAVLERTGSGVLLRDLARSGQLVVALDRREERFRLHPLLADMLRADLRRRDPALGAALHRRASGWYEQQGHRGRAIDHALDAGDVDRVGELLWEVVPTHAWGAGESELEGWLARIPAHRIRQNPKLALSAAASCLARGRRDDADGWTAAAERAIERAPALERPPLESVAALMRAAAARSGALEMERLAAGAAAQEPDDSPWRPVSCLLQGVALTLRGEVVDGRAALEDGVRRAAVATPGIEVLCLSQLALVALFAGESEQGAALAERARRRADTLLIADRPTLALACAASAFARAHRGRPEESRRDVAATTRLLRDLDGSAPWHEAPARLALARAELRLSNVAEARELIADAARIGQRIGDAPLLRRWIEDAWARADTFAVDALVGPSSLTTAELRVLRFLPSHLTFRAIGELLNVSANTIKTQAHAIYRKLDACSRAGAVDRARQLGLLDR